MAEIYPFRGIRFNLSRVGSFEKVVTQPYDKITPGMKQDYLGKSPFNIVRVILPASPENQGDECYERAASTFREWLASGVMERSSRPCLYPYSQTYQVPGSGEVRTRRGFVGLGKLCDYSEGVIRPHEHTHSGPKVDRLKLTRATGCQFGQIFMLYSDPQETVNSLLQAAVDNREPMLKVRDEYGVDHTVWQVEEEATVAAVQRAMKDKALYIADGHHRYETALTYWRERAAAGVRVTGNEAIDRAMMTFVCLQDRGLSILPTHRVVFGLKDFDPVRFLSALEELFEVTPCGPADEANLAARLREIEGARNTLLFAARGLPHLSRIALRGTADPEKLLPGGESPVWKRLDVNILHKLILEPRLGIDEKSLERADHVAYLRDPSEALGMVLEARSEGQAVFFLNPTRVEEVVSVADRGECMPQKSTDFYPKMITGLVVNQINQ
jgi:uncharacterized protein (DUF1015 family)